MKKSALLANRALWAGLSCVFFALLVAGSIHLLGTSAGSASLWALCSVQVAPVSVLTVLFTKLMDIRDVDGLTRTERRRLAHMVQGRTRSIAWMIGLLTAGSVAMALGLYGATYRPEIVLWSYAAAGGLIGISISLTIGAYFDVQHIASFRTKISDREREAKDRAALVERMTPKTSQPV